MIHITQATVDALETAVNAVDSLLLLCDLHNDRGRADRHRTGFDTVRLTCHREMRTALLDHRRKLQALYLAIAGRDPWKDIPL